MNTRRSGLLTCVLAALLTIAPCATAQMVTPFPGSLTLNFASNSTHLTTVMNVTGAMCGSFGVAASGMMGPLVSCCNPSGSMNDTLSVDNDGFNFGMIRLMPQVTVLDWSIVMGASFWCVLITPLSRLNVTPGSTYRVIFAYQMYSPTARGPINHGPNNRTSRNVTFNPSSTTAAPLTPAPSTSSFSGVVRISGNAWQRALDTNFAAVRNASAFYIAAAANVNVTQVIINSLSVGSLLINFTLTNTSTTPAALASQLMTTPPTSLVMTYAQLTNASDVPTFQSVSYSSTPSTEEPTSTPFWVWIIVAIGGFLVLVVLAVICVFLYRKYSNTQDTFNPTNIGTASGKLPSQTGSA